MVMSTLRLASYWQFFLLGSQRCKWDGQIEIVSWLIEATNYCNQHDNDGAMIVLVKARKRNTSRKHLCHQQFAESQDERTGDLVEHAQVIRSGNVGRPGKWKFPSTVDTALLAQVDTSYGWNDQQFRALDLGLFACVVCYTVIPLLYFCYTLLLELYQKIVFPSKERIWHISHAWEDVMRPSPMRRTSGYWRNCQIQLNLYKCFGPCFLANQFAVVSLVIRCGNARAQKELRWCLYSIVMIFL